MEPLTGRGRAGVGGGRTTHGHGAAAPQPDFLSAPTVPQRSAKQREPRASLQALPTDAISGALASADANPPTSTSRGYGRRGLKTRLRARISYVVVDGLYCMRLSGYKCPTPVCT
jgi:hypothetical protein